MATKKLRFEVFKRDGFRCQYCGRDASQIVLEADHIKPKSKGGSDDIDNLITSCFDCNRGKSNIELSDVPPSVKDKIKRMREQEDQIKEYNKLLAKKKRRLTIAIKSVDKIYNSYFTDYCFSDRFKEVSLSRFVSTLPVEEVKRALHIACRKTGDKDQSIKYFCGICWNKIRDMDQI